MSLGRLISRKHLTVLGLNSGTSADGLDMAVLRIAGGRQPISMLGGHTKRFPQAIRTLILRAADAAVISPEEIMALDNSLGRFMGDTAREFVKTQAARGIRIDAIGSHGQTVRHAPQTVRAGGYKVRGTMQLGSIDHIAAATGLVTVGDFRQADIALGGEGAPITTGAMHRLFAAPRESRLIVNIGGMANYFYFPASRRRQPSARDCGPGNSLSDILAQRLFGKAYDRGGAIAAGGAVRERALGDLLESLRFSRMSRSTGRETFGPALADRIAVLGRKWAPEDIMATAAELTVRGIAGTVGPLVRNDPRLPAIHLMGGGRHNQHFRRRLAALLPGLEVQDVDQLGLDGDLVEASAYAVMGAACLQSQPLPWIGAAPTLRPILGRIAQPPVRVHT